MGEFCCNMVHLVSVNEHRPLLVMSRRAHAALRDDQRATLQQFANFVIGDIDTIENIGGGGCDSLISFLHRSHCVCVAQRSLYVGRDLLSSAS